MVDSNIPRVKLLFEAGIPIAEAIKAALSAIPVDPDFPVEGGGRGMGVADVAERFEIHDTAVSATINGSTPHPNERVRNALCELLGVDREWLDPLLPRKEAA